jgi:hypothetical protein
MIFAITSAIWLSFTLFLIFKQLGTEKDYYTKLEELDNEITFLEEKIFELSPQGYSREELCDRKNPWHSQIHWYLKENTREFSELEVKHYEALIELNNWYLIYKDQPLQGYRNNSVIWEKSWCHKWSDGLGLYGLGHDHWVPGEFEYHFKTNTEFATWLTNETLNLK